MAAWGDHQNATGKIRMLADTNAQLATALGAASFSADAFFWFYSSFVFDSILFKISSLSHPSAQFYSFLFSIALLAGLDFDVAVLGNNKRMRRFSALIENGIVKIVNIEPNGAPMQCSLANEMLSRL